MQSHFWRTVRNILSKASNTKVEIKEPSRQPKLTVKEVTFKDGTHIALQSDSIVVVTGPNNSGKSSVLRTIARQLSEYPYLDPVLKDIKFQAEGPIDEFRRIIEARGLRRGKNTIMIDRYRSYDMGDIESDFDKAFVGKNAGALFISMMSAGARLDSVQPTQRGDWMSHPPTSPLQYLDIDMDSEGDISEIFKEVFGLSLIVNRFAGEKLMLHVCKGEPPEFDDFKDYHSWLSRLPTLHEQGDGMQSFAAALLGVKLHPKGLLLVDEPEAFLHYPQARRLAEVIVTASIPGTQVWIATHSDEIVRGLLDNSNDRIVVVRLDRDNEASSARVLQSDKVRALWTDPLLRTSDVLSALFHEVAVLCEGGTDVLFFRALNDAVKSQVRMPDFRLYHVGGKDKIASIATSLRLLSLPVCAICDLDALSDPEKFLTMFCALGGRKEQIDSDLKVMSRHVGQRSPSLTGSEIAVRLRTIANSVETEQRSSASHKQAIAALAREASSWNRLKVDGYRAFESATVVAAFERVYEKSKSVGLLLNREGELESLCRDATREPKSEWMGSVMSRDLGSDPSLEDARKMLGELRECIISIRHAAVAA
jgi:predicted ATPase